MCVCVDTEDTLSEDTLSEDTLSEDTLSEDTFSEDTLSEDTLSEETLSKAFSIGSIFPSKPRCWGGRVFRGVPGPTHSSLAR